MSCLTAAGVFSALDPERYEVVGVGITRSGRWVLVDDETLRGLRWPTAASPSSASTRPTRCC